MEFHDNEDKKPLHIVMFPWLAFGHMIPFLQLSKSLAQRGNRISFVSTPRNLQRLPKIPSDLAQHINFVSLPLPQFPNYPDAEATSDLPYGQVEYLKKAFDCLESPLGDFLATSSPDWIVHDFVPYWLLPVAAKLGVRTVFFSIFSASVLTFLGPPSTQLGGAHEGSRSTLEDYTVPCKWIPFENNLMYRLFEIVKIAQFVQPNVTGVTDGFRFASVIHGCDFVVVRSSNEIEPEYLSLLQEEVYQKPVIPVGVLAPPVQAVEDYSDENWTQIKDWLDQQETKRVVYMAFGSEAGLSPEETTELALGLELCELPFLWVLRTPVGETESDLPTGFEDRTKGRGFICRTWAPQHQILNHPSLGVFLTHCGWGSMIESLVYFGRPLVMLPLINDQALVARHMEWNKIAFEIPRHEPDGSFTRRSVAESLRKVVLDKEGEVYREKTKELKDIVGDMTRQERYIDDFETMLKRNNKTQSIEEFELLSKK